MLYVVKRNQICHTDGSAVIVVHHVYVPGTSHLSTTKVICRRFSSVSQGQRSERVYLFLSFLICVWEWPISPRAQDWFRGYYCFLNLHASDFPVQASPHLCPNVRRKTTSLSQLIENRVDQRVPYGLLFGHAVFKLWITKFDQNGLIDTKHDFPNWIKSVS